MKEWNIVYITDEKYVMPTCVSIISLIENNKSKAQYQVFVLLNEVSEESKRCLCSIQDEHVKCIFLEIKNEQYDELSKTCLIKDIYVSKAALFKFDIARILNNVDKVLYLDGDVIVNADIGSLYNVDISDYYVAAVNDMLDTKTDEGISALAHNVGINSEEYFNSGVMLLNLKKIREEQMPDKLLKYRVDKKNNFMDQDTFNGVLGQKRLSLPYYWNFLSVVLDSFQLCEISERFYSKEYNTIEECLCDQRLIHMAGREKAWIYNIPWITDIFKRYYERSPYGNQRLSLISPIKLMNDKLYELQKMYVDLQVAFNKKGRAFEDRRRVWKFPYSKIEKGSRVILYGAGAVGQDFYSQIMETGYCELVLWVDIKGEKAGEKVKMPSRICGESYDNILVAINDEKVAREVKGKLVRSLGVDEGKVITVF